MERDPLVCGGGGFIIVHCYCVADVCAVREHVVVTRRGYRREFNMSRSSVIGHLTESTSLFFVDICTLPAGGVVRLSLFLVMLFPPVVSLLRVFALSFRGESGTRSPFSLHPVHWALLTVRLLKSTLC